MGFSLGNFLKQATTPLGVRPQPTLFKPLHVQQNYEQQQPQRGVIAYNLRYLASQPDMPIEQGSDFMVNVPWSSHQVPYSQSLHAPAGWHPVGTFKGEKRVRLNI